LPPESDRIFGFWFWGSHKMLFSCEVWAMWSMFRSMFRSLNIDINMDPMAETSELKNITGDLYSKCDWSWSVGVLKTLRLILSWDWSISGPSFMNTNALFRQKFTLQYHLLNFKWNDLIYQLIGWYRKPISWSTVLKKYLRCACIHTRMFYQLYTT